MIPYGNRAAYKEEIKDYKGAIVDYKKAIAANPSKTEFYRNSSNTKQNFILIIIGIVIIFYLGFIFGMEYANPCLEYSTDCEVICIGEGTPAYDCWEDCPCIKRKFN